MRLPFRSFPKHLQVISVLLVASGVLQIGSIAVLWILRGDRPPGLGAAILATYGAVALVRGRRAGLGWLLVVTAFVVAVSVYGMTRGGAVAAGAVPVLVFGGALAAYLGWCWFRLPWKEPGSYRDWLTNPELRKSAADWFQRRHDRIARDAVEPPDPDELVAGLLGDDPELAEHRVRVQGERVQDALVRALTSARFRRNEDAFETALGLVPRERLASEPELVAELVERSSGSARETLLGELAASGDDRFAAEYAAELERDANPWQIAKGLASAAVGGRASAKLAAAVVPGLRRRLDAAVGRDYCAIALAHLDPGFVDDCLDRASRREAGTDDRLQTLAEFGLQMPSERWDAVVRSALEAGDWGFAARLLPHATLAQQEFVGWFEVLEAQLRAGDDGGRSGSASRACGALLARMAERCGRAAEPFLRRGVALEREGVAEVAALGLAQLEGLPADYLWRLDPDAPEPASLLYSLYAMDWRVKNGGFAMALTSPEDHAVGLLPKALDTIAPPPVREVVMEAIALLFDDQPLPPDCELREARLAERHDAAWDALDALSDRYYAVDHLLDAAMNLYAAEHAGPVRAALHPDRDDRGQYSDIR